MTTSRKPIQATDQSDFVRLLDAAEQAPVLLEREGVVYRLSRAGDAEDIWAGYDPERVRAGLREMSDIISAEEAEHLKDLVERGREEGTRPADLPYARRIPLHSPFQLG